MEGAARPERAKIAVAACGRSRAANPAFDVTPARLVSALITEHGVVAANAEAVGALPGAVLHPPLVDFFFAGTAASE